LTKANTDAVIHRYLLEVRNALDGVQPDIQNEIIEGLREELTTDDPDLATARMQQMGSPAEIARDALSQLDKYSDAPTSVVPAESAAFSAIALVAVAFGGFIFPIFGAVIGYAMVWVSRVWSTREKRIAIGAAATPIILGGIAVGIAAFAGTAPGMDGLWFDVIPYVIYSFLLVNFLVGIWLLRRRERV
jgi:hypothetical protein